MKPSDSSHHVYLDEMTFSCAMGLHVVARSVVADVQHDKNGSVVDYDSGLQGMQHFPSLLPLPSSNPSPPLPLSSQWGSFYSCTAFPACRYLISMKKALPRGPLKPQEQLVLEMEDTATFRVHCPAGLGHIMQLLQDLGHRPLHCNPREDWTLAPQRCTAVFLLEEYEAVHETLRDIMGQQAQVLMEVVVWG